MANVKEDAWVEQLYDRYGPSIFRRARTLLGDEQAAWDAVHEVFIRALNHHELFREQSSPMTWLYRITTNYCFNQLRDAARHRARLRHHASVGSLLSADDPELRMTLAELLRRMPATLCEVAIYFHVDRMTHDEIAETLGISRRTVGNRLQAFREQAQSILGHRIEVPE